MNDLMINIADNIKNAIIDKQLDINNYHFLCLLAYKHGNLELVSSIQDIEIIKTLLIIKLKELEEYPEYSEIVDTNKS